MQEFIYPLGDTVRKAREKLGLTQAQVAEKADIDVRTILNIENYHGNPKMEVLYPLVRVLKIDPWDLYYPELHQHGPELRQLQLLLTECSEEDAQALLPIMRTVLAVLKSGKSVPFE